MNKRTNLRSLRITIRVDVEKKLRMKAYKRLRDGRIQRVRSHYRRY